MESLAQYPFLKPCFWSYTLEKLNVTTHKKLIIKQVLNYGSKEATDWLQQVYLPGDIAHAITTSRESEWVQKSLALWSLMYNTKPMSD